jgi:hypothetical protein
VTSIPRMSTASLSPPQAPHISGYAYSRVIEGMPWPVAVYLVHEAHLRGLLKGAVRKDLMTPMTIVAESGQLEVGGAAGAYTRTGGACAGWAGGLGRC